MKTACRKALQTPQGSGRRRPTFSVPRLRRGVHRPAAAALRSGAGVGWWAWLLSRGCGGSAFARLKDGGDGSQFPRAAGWSFSAESGGLAYQLSSPPVHGHALCRSIALQRLCRLYSAFVLVE
jgi:hypothetical protein